MARTGCLTLALAAWLAVGLRMAAAEPVVQGDVTFWAIDRLIPRCEPVVVSIEEMFEPGRFAKLGTGCVVNLGDPLVLTCKHVAEATRAGGPLAVGMNTNEGKLFMAAHVARVSPTLDLAALKLDEPLVLPPRWTGAGADSVDPQQAIGPASFAADSEITPGTGALTIGFPLGLGNEVDENHPVSELGIVAQGVYFQPRFLVNAAASRGSSGAPVFLCRNAKFAGIVYGDVSDTITVTSDSGVKFTHVPYATGLTACIPASVIRAFLEER